MKYLKLLVIAALVTAILFATNACGQTVQPSAAPAPATVSPTAPMFPLTITDSNGNNITLQKPPERIVAIDSAAVEILFAIGEGKRVVGTHKFVTYPPETASIEKIGDAFNINLEKIAALKPDLIYIFYPKFMPDLQALGVPVLYLKTPASLKEVAGQIRLWGKITGRPDAAEQLATKFENDIATVTKKIQNVTDGPKVYHDASPGLWTTGSGSLVDEIYTLLKAKNIFEDISGYKQVSAEQIVARDPQVIISVFPDGPAQFTSNTTFKNIAAVKGKQVFVIDGSLLDTPGPRLTQGINQLAKLFYPKLFP